MGGVKNPNEATQWCMDISKYLRFAKKEELDPNVHHVLYAREMIWRYITAVEQSDVKASGLITKLTRIRTGRAKLQRHFRPMTASARRRKYIATLVEILVKCANLIGRQ